MKYFLILLMVSIHFNSSSQELERIYQDLEEWYYSQIPKSEDPLYHGVVDPLRIKSRSTRPYLYRSWRKGTLIMQNAHYHSIDILYDLITQSIMLRPLDPGDPNGLVLNMLLLKEFSIENRRFRRARTDMDSSFYEVLYEGVHFELLAKRKKIEEVSPSEVIYKNVDHYYIEYGGSLFRIKKARDLGQIWANYKTIGSRVRQKEKVRFTIYDESKLIHYIKAIDGEI